MQHSTYLSAAASAVAAAAPSCVHRYTQTAGSQQRQQREVFKVLLLLHTLGLCRHVHAGLVLHHNVGMDAARSVSPLLPLIATTAHPADGLLWVQMLPASAAHELVLTPAACLPPKHYGSDRRQAAFCLLERRGERDRKCAVPIDVLCGAAQLKRAQLCRSGVYVLGVACSRVMSRRVFQRVMAEEKFDLDAAVSLCKPQDM
jgi:hypothetical protein